MKVVQVNKAGAARILQGQAGMIFLVDEFTDGFVDGKVAHVRDYRFPSDAEPYHIWSVPEYGYMVMETGDL